MVSLPTKGPWRSEEILDRSGAARTRASIFPPPALAPAGASGPERASGRCFGRAHPPGPELVQGSRGAGTAPRGPLVGASRLALQLGRSSNLEARLVGYSWELGSCRVPESHICLARRTVGGLEKPAWNDLSLHSVSHVNPSIFALL